ncbi:unnamed protein product [Pipistrellus nathusii]|uniref:Uncharacterized protein n=1 Tax=Pipistrellus nathusii TaxID=59473 RepID=A0ABN9ZKR1_PIPNA
MHRHRSQGHGESTELGGPKSQWLAPLVKPTFRRSLFLPFSGRTLTGPGNCYGNLQSKCRHFCLLSAQCLSRRCNLSSHIKRPPQSKVSSYSKTLLVHIFLL